jgi:hypothetical protein
VRKQLGREQVQKRWEGRDGEGRKGGKHGERGSKRERNGMEWD